jgi:hypothetical protein
MYTCMYGIYTYIDICILVEELMQFSTQNHELIAKTVECSIALFPQ